MKKLLSKTLAVTLITALCLSTAGCSSTSVSTKPQTSSSAPSSSSDIPVSQGERVITVTDMSGDSVTITNEVKRIVNLWPSGTSSFFALGAGDLVVGLSSVNTLSEWTKFFYPDCVNITNLGSITPSIEDIIKLEPDLVIVHPSSTSTDYPQQIRNTGIPAINIDFDNYETMIQAYTILGNILGGEYQQKLTKWCGATESKITNVKNLTSNLGKEDRPVIFYITGHTSSMTKTMAADSIFSDWAESAGAIYGSRHLDLAGESGNEVTPEAVFTLNPDIIICGGIFQHVITNNIVTSDGWKELNAVKNNRLYTNPYGCFNWERFGLESQLQINYALMCLQPEIAEANGINRESMIGEVMDFYHTYTGFDLTRQQAGYMLDGLNPDGTAEKPVQ